MDSMMPEDQREFFTGPPPRRYILSFQEENEILKRQVSILKSRLAKCGDSCFKEFIGFVSVAPPSQEPYTEIRRLEVLLNKQSATIEIQRKAIDQRQAHINEIKQKMRELLSIAERFK